MSNTRGASYVRTRIDFPSRKARISSTASWYIFARFSAVTYPICGSQQDVFELADRMVRRQGLFAVHVDGGTGDLFLLESFEQRRLVHDLPPRGVYEISRGFHEAPVPAGLRSHACGRSGRGGSRRRRTGGTIPPFPPGGPCIQPPADPSGSGSRR